jgi:hypothetical protein
MVTVFKTNGSRLRQTFFSPGVTGGHRTVTLCRSQGMTCRNSKKLFGQGISFISS